MVERQEGEYVAVDLCGLFEAVVGHGGGTAEALGERKADGLDDVGRMGRGEVHAEEGALDGAHDALAGVGEGAVEIEEDVFVGHIEITDGASFYYRWVL